MIPIHSKSLTKHISDIEGRGKVFLSKQQDIKTTRHKDIKHAVH